MVTATPETPVTPSEVQGSKEPKVDRATLAQEDKPQLLMTDADYKVQSILVTKIFADDDFNCRGHITGLDVIDLAKDIAKSGLQSPIIIQPWDKVPGYDWRCVAGYRRLMAFRVNKTEFIPAFIRSGLSDLEARKINLKENLIRKDLNVLQEAKAIAPYINAFWTEMDIANEFEQSRGWVQIRKAVLQLPKDIQKEVAAGLVTQENIRRLASMRTPDEQYEFIRKLKDLRDRGEKIKLDKPVRKIAAHDRKHRNPTEIYAMNEYIMSLIGPCLATRYAAWCAGAINDIEWAQEVRDYCEREGVLYEPHPSVADVMR